LGRRGREKRRGWREAGGSRRKRDKREKEIKKKKQKIDKMSGGGQRKRGKIKKTKAQKPFAEVARQITISYMAYLPN
jgi:hypothetical protein